ncbi:hypothetical protein LBMAG53_38750 [Planctomycetota bacterium]|nr:hypothetical protein LBMAG53_38750 [Planctomycetota bacterium]
MRFFHTFFILLCFGWLAAGDSATLTRNSVRVTVTVESDPTPGYAVLVGRYEPLLNPLPLHLYPTDVPADAVGQGVATRLDAQPPLVAVGALVADRPVELKDGVRVLPAGPVTVRQRVRLPAGDGSPVVVGVLVSWMACDAESCKVPVRNARLELSVPTVVGSLAIAGVQPVGGTQPSASIDPTVFEPVIRAVVRDELTKSRESHEGRIRWSHPTTPEAAIAAITAAHAAGKPALLDVTGPSCTNCQLMKKTVFQRPDVIAAWNRGVPISLDTDPPNDALAKWVLTTFQADTRPMYVRIDPGAKPNAESPRWSKVFAASDQEQTARLVAFLGGGSGEAAGGNGLGAFLLLAVLGGLVTLLMPCTYPMIPFTLNMFAKQASQGRPLLPLALVYGLGIVLCFMLVGVVVTGVFGSSLATFSGHPLTNLAVAVLFLGLGLSLIGAFFLHLPAGWEDRLGGSRAGYLGALVMGLTFAVTGFTCAAPFAGAVLAQAATTGSWGAALLGMAVYGLAIAIPFVALALLPGAVKALPRSGGWLNEVKVVGGIVELAAALKFLVVCDVAWGWSLIGRTTTLAAWAALAGIAAFYLLGRIRLPGDSPVVEVGPWRLLIAAAFLFAAIGCAAGLAGTHLGLIESFFPGDAAPPLPGSGG